MKRVHHRLLWISRELLEILEANPVLTPARLDLMRVLVANPRGISRFRLVLLLGVSGPVVSRMLKALEDAGFLKRERGDDRRTVLITATYEAVTHVKMLVARMQFENRVPMLVRCCFTSSRRTRRRELVVLERFLLRARYRLGDPTPFPHPWDGRSVVDRDGHVCFIDDPPPTFAPVSVAA